MKRFVLFTGLFVLVMLGGLFTLVRGWDLFLPAYPDNLDGFMESRRTAMDVPGMAAGLINADGLAWEGYYGTYDGEHPVSADTLFMTASVSKTVVATAIMQLWEQKRFALDDDINTYLDFQIRNPHHPEAVITFRHLMTHRSSITDRRPLYDDLYTIRSGGGDSPYALGTFLKAYLVADGQFYSPNNYLDAVPGERFEYTNYGTALLAYVVELLSGEDFSEYCRCHIFAPLGMEHTYYRVGDIPASETQRALPFQQGVALPYYSFPDYPSGSLRTTIRDLGRFASLYLGFHANRNAVLQPETIALMFGKYGESDDLGEDQMGLLWVHMDWIFLEAIGHTGGDPGVATFFFLYPEHDFATIIFMNGNPKGYIGQRDVVARLYNEGTRRSQQL